MIHRFATTDDQEALSVILAGEMQPEIGLGAVDWEKGSAIIRDLMDHGIIGLVMDGDEIAATFGLIESDYFWWSREIFITDRWIFVRPKYRRTRAAFMMMEQITKIARSVPTPVLLAISSPVEIELKSRLFERYGDKMGIFYKIRSDGGSHVRRQ